MTSRALVAVVVLALGCSSSSPGGGGAGKGGGAGASGAGGVVGGAGSSGGAGSGGGAGTSGGAGPSGGAGSSGAGTSGGAGMSGGAGNAAAGSGGGAGATSAGGAGGAAAGAGGTSSPGACAAPVASAPPVVLADFEAGAIPTSDSAPKGFRGSDVARGTIIMPGGNGTTKAARFSFAADDSLFYQSATRPMYLGGSATYNADLANALAFWMRIPAGSPLLAASGGLTFSVYTYHWRPGDPWVGTNAGGANLTDSQMHGYGPMRFDPAAADKWIRVVMSASAFDHSRGNYHFYAAQAVAEDKTFFGTLRQFQPVFLADRTGTPTVDYDELSLVTLPPTAAVCPSSYAASVPAAGGDVVVPVVITNPTATARTYHAFLSSVIGLDRQTIEVATHDADDVSAVDNLQGAVSSDGGLGAARLFANDGTGKPTGPDLLAAGGAGIPIAAGGSFRGVVVHHVTAAMLGPMQTVMNAGHSYNLRRDTLTTSLVVWDPSAARVGDAAAVFTGSNADASHPAPPGFPPFADPPAGWHSADVPPDQVGGYFVSVLRLTP